MLSSLPYLRQEIKNKKQWHNFRKAILIGFNFEKCGNSEEFDKRK